LPDSKTIPRGLGRGLSALLPEASSADDGTDLRLVPVDRIHPNPHQPRKDFKKAELAELTASIVKNGILQPLLVTRAVDGYRLIAGERRWRAAKTAGLTEVPVRILSDLPESAALELSLIENLQREDLNPVELAEGYRQLQKEFHLTQEQIAQRVGKERATVANTLRLLDLPEVILNSLRQGDISAGHAKVILSLDTNARRSALHKRILADHLSVRQAEEAAKSIGKTQSRLPKSSKTNQPPLFEDYRHRLMQCLGTRVQISKRGKKGAIRIDFYSDDDLDRILSLILHSNKS